MTIKETAPVLSVAEITLRRLLRKGEIPHHRIGSRYLFTESDIEEYLSTAKVPAKQRRDGEAV
jgi:excisionase family DNA binding protein